MEYRIKYTAGRGPKEENKYTVQPRNQGSGKASLQDPGQHECYQREGMKQEEGTRDPKGLTDHSPQFSHSQVLIDEASESVLGVPSRVWFTLGTLGRPPVSPVSDSSSSQL
jgi:hypothetical protein